MGWTWLLKLLCLRFTIFWKIGEYLISSRGLAPCFIEAPTTGPVCSCMSSPCPGNEGPLERRPSDFFQLRFRDVMSCLSVTIKAATWKAKMGSEANFILVEALTLPLMGTWQILLLFCVLTPYDISFSGKVSKATWKNWGSQCLLEDPFRQSYSK